MPARQRTLTLIVMCVGMFLVLLDVTIVNVALPSLRADLGAGVSELQWIVDGYAVAIAALMLLTESLVEWLATVVGSEALAALIVGGVMALIAIGLGLWGRSTMTSSSLAPERTMRSLKRDVEVLSERGA